MSTQDINEKSIRVISFSGKKSDWRVWSRKFLARANRLGYKDLLEGKVEVPKESEYDAAKITTSPNDDEKYLVECWKLNERAFEDILLSIDGQTKSGRVAFNLVDNCTTTDQPDGNCKLAWDRLVHKYAPKTAPSFIKLKKDFANSKLKSVDADPEQWLTELESLRSEMNKVTIAGKSDMTDVDLIIHVLANLPEEYEVAVSKLEEKLKDSRNPLELEDVREELNSRFERITKHAAESKDDKALMAVLEEEDIDIEKAFAAFVKQFKGLCNKCGKYGHKGADCKEESNNNNDNNQSSSGKRRVKCNYCGKFGHVKDECRKLKEKQARLAKEQGKYAADEDNSDSESECSDDESYAELGFAARSKRVTFNLEGKSDKTMPTKKNKSKVQSVLKGEKGLKCVIGDSQYPSFTKNTWTGDTGASCFITNDDSDMYDVEPIDESIGGIGPDPLRATKKGKKKCLIKQADGTLTEKVLYPCKYAADASDNLFSITAELNHGAQITNDQHNNITLTYPDDSKIIFDRRLKTKDGWITGVDIVSPHSNDEMAKGESGDREKTKNINDLHKEYSHASEATTRATAKARGIKPTGIFQPCESCLVGKARKTNISKEPNERSKVPGERLMLDISSPNTVSLG